MKNYFKRIETGLIIVIILVLGVAYGALNNKAQAPATTNNQADGTSEQSQIPDEGEVAIISFAYDGVEGQTALALLKANFLVETKSFGDMGEFVTAINGIDADTSSQFWAFYLNGQQSQIGAGQYVTKSSDKIEWKLEDIK